MGHRPRSRLNPHKASPLRSRGASGIIGEAYWPGAVGATAPPGGDSVQYRGGGGVPLPYAPFYQALLLPSLVLVISFFPPFVINSLPSAGKLQDRTLLQLGQLSDKNQNFSLDHWFAHHNGTSAFDFILLNILH